MGPFDCQPLTRVEVARQLAEAQILESRDLPGATLYFLKHDAREWLLVALPGGTGLVVGQHKPQPRRRRSNDATAGKSAL